MKKLTKNFINTGLFIGVSAIFIILFLSGRQQKWTADRGESAPISERWTVVKVSDGDTITVRQTNSKEIKVRLACIDAPETSKRGQTGQQWGEESANNLQKLVKEANNEVMISIVDTDRYGRKVAEVFTSVNNQEKSLNEEQLTSGNAYLYRQYLKNCPNAEVFQRAEEIAIASRAGVWSGNYEKPWDYRKQQRQR
jgi:micrococcal nuclease